MLRSKRESISHAMVFNNQLLPTAFGVGMLQHFAKFHVLVIKSPCHKRRQVSSYRLAALVQNHL